MTWWSRRENIKSDFENGLFRLPKRPKLDPDCVITETIPSNENLDQIDSKDDNFRRKIRDRFILPPLGAANLLRLSFAHSNKNVDLEARERYHQLIVNTPPAQFNLKDKSLNESGFAKLFDTSLFSPKPKEDMGNFISKLPWIRDQSISRDLDILEQYREAVKYPSERKLVPYDDSIIIDDNNLSFLEEKPLPQGSQIKREVEVEPIPLNESLVKKGLDNQKLNDLDLKRTEERFKSSRQTRKLNREIDNLSKRLDLLERDRWQGEIDLEEKNRLRLELKNLVLDIPTEADYFPPLPPEAHVLIASAWNSNLDDDEVFVETPSVKIKRKDLRTLSGLDWLNDEIINFYLDLVAQRSLSDPTLPKVYAFQTFFYTTLGQRGYGGVRRWTRKVDVFEYDIWIVPVHLSHHWCMAIIDLQNQSIEYYDSMLGSNRQVFELLSNYITEEMKDKKKQELLTDHWQRIRRTDIPTQQNGSDCGMFACKFAEYASRRAPIDFNQKHMPYYRKRMVWEICQQQLM